MSDCGVPVRRPECIDSGTAVFGSGQCLRRSSHTQNEAGAQPDSAQGGDPVQAGDDPQVVLTIPKRLRAWCLYRRSLLGDLAGVAARTVTAAVRTFTGEPTLAVGIVGCIQLHGLLANWHPHIHIIATDGGFRPDGTFVPWPAHDTAALTEAFRSAVLASSCAAGCSSRRCRSRPCR